MTYDISSPEFAAAWRLVSEALLAMVQKMGSINGAAPSHEEHPEPAPAPIPSVPAAAAATDNKTPCDVRYANSPYQQDDGTYIFKNLKQEKQEGSMFKISIYDDGRCDFEMCPLQGEQLQWLKDSKDTIVPAAVGTLHGDITEETIITTTTKGRGQQEGRQVLILTPMVVALSVADKTSTAS